MPNVDPIEPVQLLLLVNGTNAILDVLQYCPSRGDIERVPRTRWRTLGEDVLEIRTHMPLLRETKQATFADDLLDSSHAANIG